VKIVFCCYAGAGPWTPDARRTGIGGSEEAVIHLTRALADRGHDVRVYMIGGPNRRYDGVWYGNWRSLGEHRVDAAVVWRRPRLAAWLDDRVRHVGRRYLWLHDVRNRDAVRDAFPAFDKVVALSRFHRAWYPFVPDDRIVVMPNGIDPDDFAGPHPWRDPFRVVYGSDYGRGLLHLLAAWPHVRGAVAGASLRVFYGWQGIERRNPTHAREMRREFAPLLAEPGVAHLGRIGHAAVAAEFRSAGVWAYPCAFPETSCITAMKAQAGGAVPVVIPTGALAETVRHGFRTAHSFSDRGVDREALLTAWRDGLVAVLADPDRQRRIRRDMVPTSLARWTWRRAARAWECELGG
jgi:glycosyltransferase involved in cell wall biosynthesis